jgi:hypothetical protein
MTMNVFIRKIRLNIGCRALNAAGSVATIKDGVQKRLLIDQSVFSSGFMAMLKWPPVVEAWLYLDPAERADALLARSELSNRHPVVPEALPRERDRYYTMFRRLRIRQAMRRVR